MLNPQINTFTVSRLKRSTKQNIKLGLISESEYTVYGSTGTMYLVKTEPSMNCTCIDYKKNKRYCKHIYFIFLNVYKIVPDLDKVYTETELKDLQKGLAIGIYGSFIENSNPNEKFLYILIQYIYKNA
jgi:hypothetical protein